MDYFDSEQDFSPAVKAIMGQKKMTPDKLAAEKKRKEGIADVIKRAIDDALRKYDNDQMTQMPSLMGDEVMEEGSDTAADEAAESGFGGQDNDVNPDTNKLQNDDDDMSEEDEQIQATNKAEAIKLADDSQKDVADLEDDDDVAADQAEAIAEGESEERKADNQDIGNKEARKKMAAAALRKALRG